VSVYLQCTRAARHEAVASAGVARYAGDVVNTDDVIAQIETDKITIDVQHTSSKPGVLTSLGVSADDTVTVGQVIAILDDDPDKVAEAGGGGSGGSKKKEPEPSGATPQAKSADAKASSEAAGADSNNKQAAETPPPKAPKESKPAGDTPAPKPAKPADKVRASCSMDALQQRAVMHSCQHSA
jgi:2-oxoglutarate dehydrogenase E2 component (dihydrolipoamide succinyltransferase)